MRRVLSCYSICMLRLVTIWLLCVLFSSRGWAGEGPYPSTPIYNPSSKSYFQLFDDNKRPGNWEAARTRAEMKSFKGVKGRLAVVDSAETHDFIVRKFDLNDRKWSVWIGLRYWCKTHMLQWESGLPYSPSEPGRFKIWHGEWSRNSENDCRFTASQAKGFTPVYYRTIGSVTRWQAVGAAKYFGFYLVEFPTGKP